MTKIEDEKRTYRIPLRLGVGLGILAFLLGLFNEDLGGWGYLLEWQAPRL